MDCIDGKGKAVCGRFCDAVVVEACLLGDCIGGKRNTVWGRIWDGGIIDSGLFKDCIGGKGKAVGVTLTADGVEFVEPKSPSIV